MRLLHRLLEFSDSSAAPLPPSPPPPPPPPPPPLLLLLLVFLFLFLFLFFFLFLLLLLLSSFFVFPTRLNHARAASWSSFRLVRVGRRMRPSAMRSRDLHVALARRRQRRLVVEGLAVHVRVLLVEQLHDGDVVEARRDRAVQPCWLERLVHAPVASSTSRFVARVRGAN